MLLATILLPLISSSSLPPSFPHLFITKTQLSIQRGKTTCAPTQAPTEAPTVPPRFLVANFDGNTVQRCVWDESCVDSGGNDFNNPTFMTFFDQKLYVGNFGGQLVSTCDWVSATNTLGDCVNTDVDGNSWGVVAYSLSNGTSYLFVTVGSSIKRCTIAPGSGTLSGCTGTGINLIFPLDMVVYDDILYVADVGSDLVLGCPINPTTGELVTVADTQMTDKGDFPAGLAINGDYLYITYLDSDNVFKCLLATLSTSNPSPCELTAADNLVEPYGLAFDDGFAYITNAGDSSVTRCMVNTITGDLGPGCEQSTSLTLSRPVGIVFPPQV